MAEYTSADLSRLLSRNRRTVQRQASTLGLGRRIGNVLVYSDADLKALRAYSPARGCPLFTPGNRLAAGRAKKSGSTT